MSQSAAGFGRRAGSRLVAAGRDHPRSAGSVPAHPFSEDEVVLGFATSASARHQPRPFRGSAPGSTFACGPSRSGPASAPAPPTTCASHDLRLPRLAPPTTRASHDSRLPRLAPSTTRAFHDSRLPRLAPPTTRAFHDSRLPRLAPPTTPRAPAPYPRRAVGTGTPNVGSLRSKRATRESGVLRGWFWGRRRGKFARLGAVARRRVRTTSWSPRSWRSDGDGGARRGGLHEFVRDFSCLEC